MDDPFGQFACPRSRGISRGYADRNNGLVRAALDNVVPSPEDQGTHRVARGSPARVSGF